MMLLSRVVLRRGLTSSYPTNPGCCPVLKLPKLVLLDVAALVVILVVFAILFGCRQNSAAWRGLLPISSHDSKLRFHQEADVSRGLNDGIRIAVWFIHLPNSESHQDLLSDTQPRFARQRG